MAATARPTQAHPHAGGQAGAKPKLYNPRHPERTLPYQTIGVATNTRLNNLCIYVQTCAVVGPQIVEVIGIKLKLSIELPPTGGTLIRTQSSTP